MLCRYKNKSDAINIEKTINKWYVPVSLYKNTYEVICLETGQERFYNQINGIY